MATKPACPSLIDLTTPDGKPQAADPKPSTTSIVGSAPAVSASPTSKSVLGAGAAFPVFGSGSKTPQRGGGGATNSGDGDSSGFAALAKQSTRASFIDLTTGTEAAGDFQTFRSNDNVDEDDDDDDEHLVLLSSCEVKIVGIRYYDGVAHPGEWVNLVREPNNPYDANAVRVDNMSNEKVGHVKRETATVLSSLMDSGASITFKVDGTIPREGNKFQLPLRLDLYARSNRPLTAVELDIAQKQVGRLNNFGRSMNYKNAYGQGNPGSRVVSETKPREQRMVVTTEAKKMDWQAQQKDLDKMFEKQHRDQLANLVELDMPDQLQNVKLYEFQKLGIRWMVSQERNAKSPPFFKQVKEKGKKVWLCEITNCSQEATPPPIRGGILADEMGIGKTLQTIGLILANPPVSGPKTTMVVCPVSVMSNWVQQINNFVKPGILNVQLYHGANRYAIIPALKNNEIDVLIVSYHTLASDHDNSSKENQPVTNKKPANKKRKKIQTCSVFEAAFHRVVLDEAHTIRSSKTRFFNSVTAVSAQYRLCLTGTPFVNRADDVHSLFAFLGVQPLANKEVFRRAVTLAIQQGDDKGLGRLRTTMAHVALRRTKATANISLVKKEVQLVSVVFPDGVHKRIHDSLFMSARAALEATLQEGDSAALKQYTSILETLLRIRQSCCSGLLVPKERRERAEEAVCMLQGLGGKKLTAEEGKALLDKLRGVFQEDEVPECSVCLCEMDEAAAVILRSCSHVFCEPCISRVMTTPNTPCPLCRVPFKKTDLVKKSAASTAASRDDSATDKIQIDDDSIGMSPKVSCLLGAIDKLKMDEKGVIFSQFTKFLDIIENALKENGHTFTRIDGSKSATQRIQAMKDFNDEAGGPRFILCSLHTASTGINLTRGNYVFMMDCWWNQAVENQAMDRVHRLGQSRTVHAVRFVMKDSIEERIVAIQESKAALGKGTMEKLSSEENRKARVTYLKDMFLIDGKPQAAVS